MERPASVNKKQSITAKDPNIPVKVKKLESPIESKITEASEDDISLPRKSKRQIKVKCRTCGKEFASKDLVLEHERTVHVLPMPVQRQARRISDRQDTMKFSFVKTPFQCEVCKRQYSSSTALKRHQQYQCSLNGKMACEICQIQFTSRALLKEHMVGIHNTRKYTCTTCRVAFRWRASLCEHRKSCSTKPTTSTCD